MRNAFADIILVAVNCGAIEMLVAGVQCDRDGFGYVRRF